MLKKFQIFYKSIGFIALYSFLAFYLSTAPVVDAATLSLSPASSNVATGNIFTVKISVNTLGAFINNAEATLQFPTDLLEVVSITKSSSIFSLWVEDPSYSNTAGTISFNGGVANPGYNGNNGTVASVTFKAKKQGTASLIFSDASIRENDGLGTDIISGKGTSLIQIGSPKEIEITTPVIPTNTTKDTKPAKPVVTSDTHPDQNIWYPNSTASFNWKTPSGVNSVQAFTNRIPDSVPNTTYDSSVTQKTLTELPDGTFYFHIRYSNSAGWGPITHYKIKVDTKAPEAFSPTVKTVNNQSVIELKAEDLTSGIDYYNLKIDEGEAFNIKKDDLTNFEYVLPVLAQGDHVVNVVAYDKAGNHTEAATKFTSSFITPPSISLSSSEIKRGDPIIIFGKSDYPNKQVEIIFELSGVEIKKYIGTTSADGSFSVTVDNVRKVGLIKVSAKNILSNLVKSQSSESRDLRVLNSDFAKVTLTLFWVVLVVALLVLLLIVLYIGWYKFLSLKKKNKSKLQNAIEEAHRAVVLLKEELNDQLVELEKVRVDRELNKNEEMVFKEIQKNLDDVDKFIEKKLKKLL